MTNRESILAFLRAMPKAGQKTFLADLEAELQLWGPVGKKWAVPEEVKPPEGVTFDVILDGYGEKKVPVFKEVKRLTGGTHHRVVVLVNKTPSTILAGLPKDQAEEALKSLLESGAEAHTAPHSKETK